MEVVVQLSLSKLLRQPHVGAAAKRRSSSPASRTMRWTGRAALRLEQRQELQKPQYLPLPNRP